MSVHLLQHFCIISYVGATSQLFTNKNDNKNSFRFNCLFLVVSLVISIVSNSKIQRFRIWFYLIGLLSAVACTVFNMVALFSLRFVNDIWIQLLKILFISSNLYYIFIIISQNLIEIHHEMRGVSMKAKSNWCIPLLKGYLI